MPRSDRHHMTLRLAWPIREAVEKEATEREVSVNDLISKLLAERYEIEFSLKGGRRVA
jgi:hypothetical protein